MAVLRKKAKLALSPCPAAHSRLPGYVYADAMLVTAPVLQLAAEALFVAVVRNEFVGHFVLRRIYCKKLCLLIICSRILCKT